MPVERAESLRFLQVEASDVLVICDDLDLKAGNCEFDVQALRVDSEVWQISSAISVAMRWLG